MPTFDVQFAPASNGNTDLDDEGFIGGADVIEFNVTSDTPGLTATAVRQLLQAQGLLPRESTAHPTSRLSLLRTVNLRQSGPIYYEGSLNYRAVRRPQDQEDENLLPWEQPASISFRSITSEVPVDEDADGEAIVNPGTMEPVEGITRPITDFGMTITKNFIGLNPIGIQVFANRVNSDQFLLFPPGTCKTGDLSASPQFHEGVEYHSVVVPVVVRDVYGGRPPEEAWHHRRRLQGYYEIIEVDGAEKVVRALDDEMQPVSTPVLLDETGRRLPTGSPPVFRTTKRFQTVAFSSFGLF